MIGSMVVGVSSSVAPTSATVASGGSEVGAIRFVLERVPEQELRNIIRIMHNTIMISQLYGLLRLFKIYLCGINGCQKYEARYLILITHHPFSITLTTTVGLIELTFRS